MRGLLPALLVAGCGFSGSGAKMDSRGPGDGPTSDASGIDADTDADIDASEIDASSPYVRRINLGGGAHTGVDYPGMWEADPSGICGPSVWTVTGAISGTVDDALFVNHVYGLPQVTCAIGNVPVGNYRVTLLYGPTYYGVGGTCAVTRDQIFSVEIEGVTVLPAFNVTAASDGCVFNGTTGHPVARPFTIAITDGTLNVTETAPAGEAAMVSAIQLVKM
jgi:hypothetical protein